MTSNDWGIAVPSGHLAKNAFLLVWSQNVYSHIFHMRKPIKILEEDNFQIRKPIKMLEKNFKYENLSKS